MPADFKITTRISLDFIRNKWQQLEQYGNAATAAAAATTAATAARLQFQRFPIYVRSKLKYAFIGLCGTRAKRMRSDSLI